jgi:hypothetical protein
MRISKLRKKLRDKNWLENKYRSLTDDLEGWDRFEKFECCSTFVGSEKAEYNQRLYDKKTKVLYRHVRFIKKLLKIKN